MTLAAWAIALFYAVWINNYFGRHIFPASDAEVIADGLSLLLTMLAIIATKMDHRK
jgi:hypothetical protein